MKNQNELINKGNWDTIIILDACRFDMFEEVNNIQGNLQKVNSESFNTSTWYERHWDGVIARETILTSAQPMAWWKGANKNFYDSYFLRTEENDWMHPKYTIDKALELDKCDQRLLVHLIPPHLPFQGVEGKKFLDRIGATKNGEELWNVKFGPNIIQNKIEEYGRQGNWEELKLYYKENIKVALSEIKRYRKHTLRRIIITSDHGDMIGENNEYGHSHAHCLLTIVPWMEI